MSNVEYNEVTSKNGVVRSVPTVYKKPYGKRKTVAMTLPITVTEHVEEIAATETKNNNKSRAYEMLVLEALANRGINVTK